MVTNFYLQQGQTPSKCEGVSGRRAVSMLPDIPLLFWTQFTTSRSLSKEISSSHDIPYMYPLRVMLVHVASGSRPCQIYSTSDSVHQLVSSQEVKSEAVKVNWCCSLSVFERTCGRVGRRSSSSGSSDTGTVSDARRLSYFPRLATLTQKLFHFFTFTSTIKIILKKPVKQQHLKSIVNI